MAYKLLYTKEAIRDIKKLDNVTKKKLSSSILRYSKKPLLYASKLSSTKLGQYRWRAGNYRIVFDISGRTIYFLRIRHRKDIYRK